MGQYSSTRDLFRTQEHSLILLHGALQMQNHVRYDIGCPETRYIDKMVRHILSAHHSVKVST